MKLGRFNIVFWGPFSPLGMGLALLVFLADRAHKYWMVSIWDIAARGRVEVTPFFDLVMVWNRGVSYGLFTQESDAGRYGLFAFALMVTGALILWLARAHGRLFAVALGLVIGAALSNAADRLIYGAVADFFSLHAMGYYWYVFNAADIAIVAGVALLLYDSFANGHKTAENGT